MFRKGTREGRGQSDGHCNCFESNTGNTFKRRGGAHMGFLEHLDIIVNWSGLHCCRTPHRKAPLPDTEGFGLQTEKLWFGTPVLLTLKVMGGFCGRDKESRSDVKPQLPWQLNKNTNIKHCPGKNHHMI